MKALALALCCCSIPAAAWNWTARTAEAIYEVESTGNPKIDNELAERAVAVLRRRLEAFGLSGAVERRAGQRIAVSTQVFTDDHAPIEWIVNDMVIRFILEGGTEYLQ